MNQLPKVSIILPNYNHGSFLPKRVESILGQTFTDFELLILDDCSTDTSKSIIEQLKDERISHKIFNAANSGSPFVQWEKGVALAKGQYIWIAESDDYCDVNFLEKAITSLETNASDLFFSQSVKVDENNKVVGDYFFWTKEISEIDWTKSFQMQGEEFIRLTLSRKNVIINASAVVFRKSDLNFQNTSAFKSCGDWLFWMNYLAGKKVSYSAEKLNYFRYHSDSTRDLSDPQKNIQRWAEEVAVKAYLKIHSPELITAESLEQSIKNSVSKTPFGNCLDWMRFGKIFPWASGYFTFAKFVSNKMKG